MLKFPFVLINNKLMFQPIECFIGLRYLRARRRSHFISFISFTSIVGVSVGVAALITVLSVMNGFEKELTRRILGMASHASLVERGQSMQNWQALAEQIKQYPGIVGVAPYFNSEGMLVNNQHVNGVVLRGILPDQETSVSVISDKIVAGNYSDLVAGTFSIVLGQELAASLGVGIGDKVSLIVPTTHVTAIGILPRLKRFTVVGIFEAGMYEFDHGLAIIHMDDAMRVFQQEGPTGLRLKTDNILSAPAVSRAITAQLPGHFLVEDWTQRYANFFRALKTEKTVMFLILVLIVAVAAFNIIATLVMTVIDKQTDIAVLKTLGISTKSILAIFMIQGVLIGCIGIFFGVTSGVWIALNIENLIANLEQILQIKILSPDVYYISDVPSDLHWNDVIMVSAISFLFCILATIYPALKASKIHPAEALRYG